MSFIFNYVRFIFSWILNDYILTRIWIFEMLYISCFSLAANPLRECTHVIGALGKNQLYSIYKKCSEKVKKR